jgi:2-oxoglutarate ferredoxin oxidoreductase subunit alpha
MTEGLDILNAEGIHLDAMRLRAFPFPASVEAFIAEHDQVYVVEQNRDAQMHSLLVNELSIDPAKMIKVLHYDGTPITARFITDYIRKHLNPSASAVSATNKQKEVA